MENDPLNFGDYFNCYNKTPEGYYFDKKDSLFKKINHICKDSNIDCEITSSNSKYKYSFNNSCLNFCPDGYIAYNNICILKRDEQEIIISEFKDNFFSNINAYINSIQFINCTNFMGIFINSNNMNPDEQIKKGISAIDLGNCTQIIKEYYNISKYESIIVLNLETKKDINKNVKSIDLGKKTRIEIYDISGTKLDLSICKEDIKVMKYIGDVKELDIQSAKTFSEQGIDVFTARDEFFNDICHPYDSPDGRDIIINDRRTYIFQNVTFCQVGCSYLGMNYDLMVANCLCDSSLLQRGGKNITENVNIKSNASGFKEFVKSFISNSIDLNFEILRCYNLIVNKKTLIHNIGFFLCVECFSYKLFYFLFF